MTPWRNTAPDVPLLAAAGIAIALWTFLSYSLVSVAMVLTSLALCGACLWSCWTLHGARTTRIFLALGMVLGWGAEQLGSTLGWFFGAYSYTDVLGPRLGSVPVVIPFMWFGLGYIGFHLACLVLWRQPVPATTGWKSIALASFMSALLITAFDLGADPFFVYVLKAWIMKEKDGDWFGETVRGFAGWMEVSFVIVTLFQAIARPRLVAPPGAAAARASLLPIGLYVFMMAFQIAFTRPVELRVMAFFVMGIPALIALMAWRHWSAQPLGAPP